MPGPFFSWSFNLGNQRTRRVPRGPVPLYRSKAGAASEGKADYLQFEELLNNLHELGFFPEISLVSAVAKAMV
jgi:hypothetical protein